MYDTAEAVEEVIYYIFALFLSVSGLRLLLCFSGNKTQNTNNQQPTTTTHNTPRVYLCVGVGVWVCVCAAFVFGVLEWVGGLPGS